MHEHKLAPAGFGDWALVITGQSAPPQTDEGKNDFVVYHRKIRDCTVLRSPNNIRE